MKCARWPARSRDSADEIEKLISEIQGNIGHAVTTIENNRSIVGKTVSNRGKGHRDFA